MFRERVRLWGAVCASAVVLLALGTWWGCFRADTRTQEDRLAFLWGCALNLHTRLTLYEEDHGYLPVALEELKPYGVEGHLETFVSEQVVYLRGRRMTWESESSPGTFERRVDEVWFYCPLSEGQALIWTAHPSPERGRLVKP